VLRLDKRLRQWRELSVAMRKNTEGCGSGMQFKRMSIFRPEQTLRLRETLNTILDLVTLGNINHKHLVTGVNDDLFDDIEDSFQYQCAIQNKCDAFVTINLKDFNTSVCTNIDVYSPKDFVSIFL
jgi:hypothetical protein